MDIQKLQDNVDAAASRLTAHLMRMADSDYTSDAQYMYDNDHSAFLTDKWEEAKKALAKAKREAA